MTKYPGVERKREKLTVRTFFSRWVPLPFLGIFFCAFANILLSILGVTTVNEGEQSRILSYLYEMPFFTIIIECLFAPVLEELIFRKLLFGKLSKVIPWWIAMLISSVLFGVLHFNVPQGIYGFFFGLLLCETMRRTGSWIAPIIVHAMANIFSVVMNSFPKLNEYFVEHSIPLLIISGVAFLLTFLLFEFLTSERRTLENPETED